MELLIQAKMLNDYPLAFYTHYGAHRINLIAQSISSDKSIIRDMQLVNNIGNLFNNTIKYRNVFNIISNSANVISPLCPTRWTIRKDLIQKFLDKYELILETLGEFRKCKKYYYRTTNSLQIL